MIAQGMGKIAPVPIHRKAELRWIKVENWNCARNNVSAFVGVMENYHRSADGLPWQHEVRRFDSLGNIGNEEKPG